MGGLSRPVQEWLSSDDSYADDRHRVPSWSGSVFAAGVSRDLDACAQKMCETELSQNDTFLT